MLDDVAANACKLSRNWSQLACLILESVPQCASEAGDELTLNMACVEAANELNRRVDVIAKGNWPHPHQVALVVTRLLSKQRDSLVETPAEEMLAGDATIQIVVRANLLACR